MCSIFEELTFLNSFGDSLRQKEAIADCLSNTRVAYIGDDVGMME